ncbi:heme-binding protein 2 isoform X2 [Ornithorhynchus anatinus]|uniref:heme-binding protein 2 isoform X2 n=1 Tax=Ornithorhynchus anatinus TaxID=9258 RepID=UPI0010A8561C|nr:heme-binding protein 2 isoform X2 [Ornithorhynchus anatinus]
MRGADERGWSLQRPGGLFPVLPRHGRPRRGPARDPPLHPPQRPAAAAAEAKIKMTAPVTSYVEPGEGPFSQPTITVSLYIPREQQSDPPKPVESNVFIEDRPGMTVFVRSFDGVSSAVKNQEELLTLANTLRQDGKVFDEKVFYTAGYDSPSKLLNRLNEVWLVKKNGSPQSQ